MAGTLRRVAMRRPGAILNADEKRWHYAAPIDAAKLTAQYEQFVALVARSGANIVWLDNDVDDDLADSVFVYDPSFVVPGGAVVMRAGKPLRAGEAELHAAFYAQNDIPIVGTIDVPGTIEGGDCFWLDRTTLAVGRGFRTNQDGIEQLTQLLAPLGVDVVSFDLPVHLGADACLHLMSVVSPLDHDLALVYSPLMPTALYQLMLESGYTLIDAPADEFHASLGLNLNVLATAPRQVIAVAGFEQTAQLMRESGCDVATFEADALCIPCEGGPTCLTRPLLRD